MIIKKYSLKNNWCMQKLPTRYQLKEVIIFLYILYIKDK